MARNNNITDDTAPLEFNAGVMDQVCIECGALFWDKERNKMHPCNGTILHVARRGQLDLPQVIFKTYFGDVVVRVNFLLRMSQIQG